MSEQYPAKNDYYGSTAEHYDVERFTNLKGRWLDQKEKRSVARALQGVEKSYTVLDLPCGTGRILDHVLSLGFRASGGDISNEMIDLARRRIGDHERLIGYHRVDAQRTGLETGSYDCITSVRLMGHLPPTVKVEVIREMARVARRFLVITFYEAGPVRTLKWMITRRTRLARAAWHPVRSRDLPQLFAQCGVTPVGHWRVYPFLSDGITYLLRIDSN